MQPPEFDFKTHGNDICVVRLAREVDLYANPFVKPACLPSAYLNVADRMAGQAAITAGWGLLVLDQKIV